MKRLHHHELGIGCGPEMGLVEEIHKIQALLGERLDVWRNRLTADRQADRKRLQ